MEGGEWVSWELEVVMSGEVGGGGLDRTGLGGGSAGRGEFLCEDQVTDWGRASRGKKERLKGLPCECSLLLCLVLVVCRLLEPVQEGPVAVEGRNERGGQQPRIRTVARVGCE